jgi:hypothetical protein
MSTEKDDANIKAMYAKGQAARADLQDNLNSIQKRQQALGILPIDPTAQGTITNHNMAKAKVYSGPMRDSPKPEIPEKKALRVPGSNKNYLAIYTEHAISGITANPNNNNLEPEQVAQKAIQIALAVCNQLEIMENVLRDGSK